MSAMPKISLLGFQHYKPKKALSNRVDLDEMARMFGAIKWIYSVFLLNFLQSHFQDKTPFKRKWLVYYLKWKSYRLFLFASDINECDSSPCSENANDCINTPGSFTCDCTDTGYEGALCDTGKRRPINIRPTLKVFLFPLARPCFTGMGR